MKAITVLVSIIYLFSCTFAYASYKCFNKKAKFEKCSVKIENGILIMDYKKNPSESKRISGKKMTKLTGGEYARRRVAESVALGVLVAPLALFGLFSKKKRDNYGIEYIDDQGNPNATVIQMKKKYSLTLKSQLQSISGLTVEFEERDKKK